MELFFFAAACSTTVSAAFLCMYDRSSYREYNTVVTFNFPFPRVRTCAVVDNVVGGNGAVHSKILHEHEACSSSVSGHRGGWLGLVLVANSHVRWLCQSRGTQRR